MFKKIVIIIQRAKQIERTAKEVTSPVSKCPRKSRKEGGSLDASTGEGPVHWA